MPKNKTKAEILIELEQAHKRIAELESSESEKRLRAMLEISQAMSASLEMDTVLQKIVENAAGLLQLESGAIYTLEGDELFLEATTPPLPPDFPDELRHANVTDHPHIQTAISSGSIVVLADSTSAKLSSAEKMVAEARGLRSIVYVPLMISEKAIGVFIVASVDRVRTFSEEEINLYSGFSGQAAQTIENIRLYRSEREYAAELETQIAERRQAEEKLRDSEERLRQIANNVGEVVWMFDNREQKLVYLNAAYEKIWGRSIEETYQNSQNYIDAIHPEDRNILFAALERQGQGERTEMEYRVVHLNGTIYWISDRSFPIYGEDGTLIRTTGIATDITARKQAESNLRASEERMRLATETTHLGIWEWNLRTNKIRWDAEMFHIYGLPPSVDGMIDYIDWSSAVEASELAQQEAILQETAQRCGQSQREFHIRRKNTGELRSIFAVETVRVDMSGEPEWVVGTNIDVTERKRAEDDMRESERKYRDLINGMNDAVWVIDMDMRFLDLNDAAVRTLGYSRDELLSMKVSDIDSAIRMEQIQQLIDRLSVEKLQVFETRHKAKDGREIPIEVSSSLVSYMGRTVIMSIARDVTDRKRAEEEARHAEQRYRALIENAPDGVVLIDIAGKFKYASPSVKKLFGYEQDEAMGGDPNAMTHPDDLPIVINELMALIEDPSRVTTLQYRFKHKNGEWRWIESTFSNLLMQPSVEAIIINFRDIHERKLAEEALDKSQALLTEAQRIGRIGHMEWIGKDSQLVCSDELYDILELPRGTIITKQVIGQMMLPGEGERIHALEMQVIKTHADMEYEYRILTESGVQKWLHQIGKVTYGDDGLPIRIMFIVQDITERKLVEEQLRVEQIRFAQVEATIPGAICTFKLSADGSFNLPYASLNFEDLFGLSLADVSENVDAILEKIQQEQIASLLNAVYESAANLTPWRNEFHYRHPRKGDVWLEGYSMPLRQADGSTIWHGVTIDITERRLAEEALRNNEERLRTVADFTYDMEFWVDENRTLQYMSPSCQRITGYERNQFIKDPALLQHIVYPEDRSVFDKHSMEEFDLPDSCSIHFRIITADSEIRWINHTCQAVMGADGTFRGRRVSHRDITERRQALQELRASEEKYRGLLESLDSVVANIDLNGKFLYMNDMAAEQLSGAPEQFIGKTMYELFPEPVAKLQMRDIQSVVESDQGMVFENPSIIKGKPRWYRTSIQPLHDENGHVASVLVNSTDIHELKTAQQELQELNRTLEEKVAQRTAEVQDLYENAPTGYHSVNAEGKFVMVNQTELNWLGFAREEMIGRTAIDFITEDTRGVFQENFPLLIQRGWVKDVEFDFVRKDGSVLPVSLSATSIYDEAGNFIMTRSTIFDNTERKQAENELKRNINFTTALLNAVPTPVFYKDKEGRYLGCNRSFVELMGKTTEEIQGKLPHEVWHASQADLYRQKDLDLMEANERQFYESVVTDKNGVVRPVIFVKDLFYDEGGNVAGLVGAFIDISERKQAENAIRESEATYRALFENSNDGIFLMDATGEELRANQRALDMVGYTLEEYLTLGHINQNPFAREEDQRKDADDKLAALLRGETVPLYERIFTAKDGHKVPVEVNLSPVRDENGKIIMVQSVVRDIAERKAAEEALKNINKELERALLVKDEFLANMSHELRTPLNGILGFSEMLLSNQFGTLSERQNKYISSIESSGKHLLGLINDLLDLAKIDAGKLDITLENVVISELCQSSLMFVKQMALNKNIQLSFEQDMTYPYVVGDQRRLKQILVNLLSNAVKFTPEHGRVTLRVVADPAKDCIDFAVEDTGIGISQADLLRLFKPFTQVDSSLARQHEGTGLGLALVQKLAELHGGGVSVQSEIDKGSIFTVCIPGRYMTGLNEKTEHPASAEQRIPTGLEHTGAKILLAEDIESNIVILGDYLEHQGYELIYAKNGQEALEKAKETLPNLILMDIQMPVLDGLAATRRLRADPRFATVPIIALTALAMTGDRERCLEAGATEYVSKPANLKKLTEMIGNLLKSNV